MNKKAGILRKLLFFLVLTTIGVSCEHSFEPIKVNDNAQFSLYGAFDLSADTQWVRVMPVLDSLVWRTPKPIDAEVRLIHTSSGEETILNDSLFVFPKGYFAWNFWTSNQLIEGEEYRLIAEDSEGNQSSATFHMPMNFPDPTVEYSYITERGRVYGSGVDTLVVADGIYDITINRGGELETEYGVRISHLKEVQYGSNGDFEFLIHDLRAIAEKFSVRQNDIGILYREMEVASGNEDWPDVADLVQDEIILPQINSNVVNGTGVVVGIVSKRTPL